MPFSHHSHSGQFCGHATNTLEEVIQDAIAKGMHTFCLTEHIPREQVDFYPEEIEHHSEESLANLFDDYYQEATRLREKYKDKIHIFIGFEGEWIRPSTMQIINGLQKKYDFDLFVGSIHHMHTIPIDFDDTLYRRAREAAGGTDEQLFSDYFDAQLEMLQALQPPVVGHFDLIRLKSDDPERSFKTWPSIWSRICRNLRYIADYGGVLELNSASLRKGMSEPYPKTEVCQEFLELSGRFTLSDDSHGIAQVGLNFLPTVQCAVAAGITELVCLTDDSGSSTAGSLRSERRSHLKWKPVNISDVASLLQDQRSSSSS